MHQLLYKFIVRTKIRIPVFSMLLMTYVTILLSSETKLLTCSISIAGVLFFVYFEFLNYSKKSYYFLMKPNKIDLFKYMIIKDLSILAIVLIICAVIIDFYTFKNFYATLGTLIGIISFILSGVLSVKLSSQEKLLDFKQMLMLVIYMVLLLILLNTLILLIESIF